MHVLPKPEQKRGWAFSKKEKERQKRQKPWYEMNVYSTCPKSGAAMPKPKIATTTKNIPNKIQSGASEKLPITSLFPIHLKHILPRITRKRKQYTKTEIQIKGMIVQRKNERKRPEITFPITQRKPQFTKYTLQYHLTSFPRPHYLPRLLLWWGSVYLLNRPEQQLHVVRQLVYRKIIIDCTNSSLDIQPPGTICNESLEMP